MFVSSKRYEREMKNLKWELERADMRYWKLRKRHDRLLDHLGLYEYEISRETVLCTKPKQEKAE